MEPIKSTMRVLQRLRIKVSTLDKICCSLAEILGTTILIFLGCMGCVETDTFSNSRFPMNLNFGLVVMTIIQCFGYISGAHLNPVVTIAAYVYNLVTLPMAVVYFVAQLIGGFIGYGLLKVVLPPSAINPTNSEHGLCITVIHEEITAVQGFLIEFIITCILITACCSVWDPRNSKYQDSVPLRFGLIITCLAYSAGPFTGASMNPVRTLAPAIWHNDYKDHWVYWVGPTSASIFMSVIYKAVFSRKLPNESLDHKLRSLQEV